MLKDKQKISRLRERIIAFRNMIHKEHDTRRSKFTIKEERESQGSENLCKMKWEGDRHQRVHIT